MTYEEAKEKLENCACSVYWEETLDTAIEALEKQIPKKPTIREGLMCCDCGDYLCNIEQEIKPNFCKCCGQAIDWNNYSCIERKI